MPIPQSTPVRFTPRGLCDAYDSTDVFPGACRKLSNLVFDPSNPEIVIARPGVGSGMTSFAGFTTPGFVSLQVTIGTRVYGMVATGLTANHDEPFCYEMATSSFIAISGVTAGNAEGRPVSPASSGAWVPPTLAVIGAKIIITHPGYTGLGANFFGIIDISNPAVPVYTTANTATNALPSVPTGVANYNNRAYFICKNVVYYSDVLVPATMTNAGQSLTIGDTTSCVALSGLPVQTTSGGVVAILLAFKSSQIWQITGDAAISGSLSVNWLSLNVGTASARSLASSPIGTFFSGPDGPYLVSPTGAVTTVSSNIGQNGAPDLRQPFSYATEPSRVAAAFSGSIYRICIPTIIDGMAGTYDYWFDLRKMRWNGPHTFVYDCASGYGSSFVLSGVGTSAVLFSSTAFPSAATTYLDNAVSYNADIKSSDFPKRDQMAMKQVVESTIELSSSGVAASVLVSAYDDSGALISSATVSTPSSGRVWGSNLWGDGSIWRSTIPIPVTYRVDWPGPLVFKKMAIEAICPASASIAIGTFYARTQKTGYTIQQ